MDPQHYLRILRRRWKLVAAFTVAGLLFGVGSAAFVPEAPPPDSQFIAVHTLISDEQPDERDGSSLEQARFFATTGAVPMRVAETIGGDPLRLAARIRATANLQLGTVQIAAFGKDPEEVALLADTFATELAAYATEESQARYEDASEELRTNLDQLEDEYLQESENLAALPEDEQRLAEAKLQGKADEISAVEQQIEALEREGPDAAQLRTLQQADAFEVTETEMERFLAEEVDPLIFAAGEGGGSPSASPTENPILRGLLGALLGFGAGITLVLVLGRYDRRIHDKAHAEEAFRLPVITEIPPLPRRSARDRVLSLEAPRSATAEAYRTLRSSLVYLGSTSVEPRGVEGSASEITAAPTTVEGAKVIMVTSPGPSEGKTTTAANLAAVLGEAGLSVLVVNCDYRKPQIHTLLGTGSAPRKVYQTSIPGVRLVADVVDDPAHASPSEVLAEQLKVIAHARSLFDIVLLDTAPLLTTNDAVDVLPETGVVVLVARAGRTTREAAERAAELLERHGAPMAGVVLIGAQEAPSTQYHYYYRSYHASPREERSNGDGPATPAGAGTEARGDRAESLDRSPAP